MIPTHEEKKTPLFFCAWLDSLSSEPTSLVYRGTILAHTQRQLHFFDYREWGVASSIVVVGKYSIHQFQYSTSISFFFLLTLTYSVEFQILLEKYGVLHTIHRQMEITAWVLKKLVHTLYLVFTILLTLWNVALCWIFTILLTNCMLDFHNFIVISEMRNLEFYVYHFFHARYWSNVSFFFQYRL